MPNFSCSISDIQSDTTCSDKAGIVTVFLTSYASVNWTDMALGANYDDTTHTILTWVMNAGGEWSEFTFERKPSLFTGTYTSANGYYEILLSNLNFKGKSAARSLILGQLVSCCNVVAQVHDSNGNARIFGAEFIDGAWTESLEGGRVSRHLDTTGAFGAEDDKNRDELDFTAEHINPMPYSTVDIATMRTI